MTQPLLLLLLLFTTVHCHKCCPYPSQWEATERLTSGSVDHEGHTAVTAGTVNISVDGSNQRVATNNSFTVGNITQTFSTLLLYKQRTMFTIEGSTCVQETLGKWEPPFCLPDNSSFISQYHLGPRYNVRVAEFSYNIQGGLTINMGVTLSACSPVVHKVYGRIHNQNIMTVTTFNGLTFGIKDEHVFDIPVICQKN